MNLTPDFKIWFPTLDNHFEQDELNDVFENHVFELKNVLSISIALSVLFESKLLRFSKIVSTYNSVSNIKLSFNSKIELTSIDHFTFSNIILEALDTYFSERNKILMAIRSAQECSILPTLASFLCQLEKEFSLLWFTNFKLDFDVVMSKIPDPMELRKAVQYCQSQNITTFSELANEKTIQNTVIKTELYRRILITNYGK